MNELNQCQMSLGGLGYESTCESYDAEVKSKLLGNITVFWVECPCCGMKTEAYLTEQEAVDSWNKINHVEPPRELTEAERLEMEQYRKRWSKYFSRAPMTSLFESCNNNGKSKQHGFVNYKWKEED